MAIPLDNSRPVKYQGKEVEATIQAPDEASLKEMLAQMTRFTSNNGMGKVQILSMGKDPDGGYKAIVTAHNWNPVKWVKEKFSKKEEPVSTSESRILGLAPSPETEEQAEVASEEAGKQAYESYLKGQEAKAKAEGRDAKGRFTKRQSTNQQGSAGQSTNQQSAPPLPPPPPPNDQTNQTGNAGSQNENAGEHISWEEFVRKEGPGEEDQYSKGSSESKVNKKKLKEQEELFEGLYVYGQQNIPNWASLNEQQKREALGNAFKGVSNDRVRDTAKTYREAAHAASEAGTSFQGYETVRTYQPGYYVDKETGKKVPKPTNAEEERKSEYVPGQSVIQKVVVNRSPAQVLYEAEMAKTGLMQIREVQEQFKEQQRQRKWAPVRKVGNVAKEITNVAVLGMAGVAQGMRPGRGGPQRAERIVAPHVDMRLYGVSRPSAAIVARPNVDLSHLRQATNIGNVRKQVHQVARRPRLF